jgi:hypothetical protein
MANSNHDAASLPQASPDEEAPPDSDWIPVMGRVIKGVVLYYNPKTHACRVTKRWHGARVTEQVKLPPQKPADSATG